MRGSLRGYANGADMAEVAFQTFALRFVSGAFKGANPGRGRFRDYLKTALRHLVADQQRQAQANTRAQPLGDHQPAVVTTAADDDREFIVIWREGLVARALKQLEASETCAQRLLYPILHYVMDHPGVRSAQVAEEFSARLQRAVDDAWVRKRLMYARQELAELIVQDVEAGLEVPTTAAVEQELIELGLLEHCRSALAKRRKSS